MHHLNPRIVTCSGKKLVGKRLTMSLARYRSGELWGRFMPVRKYIHNTVSTDLFSVAVYQPAYFTDFSPANVFERWAAVEVTDFNTVPPGMETLELPGGLYAVFHYKGRSNDPSVFQYIYTTWLPASDYRLDDRPHVEVLGPDYKNNDPASEETICIPVQCK